MKDVFYELMAIEPEVWDPKWFEEVIEIFHNKGFETFRHKFVVEIWREVKQVGTLRYSDALNIKSVEVSQGRRALGIFKKRLYFVNDSKEIDRRREFLITKKPPKSDLEKLKDQQVFVRDALKNNLQKKSNTIDLKPVDLNLSSQRIVKIGNNSNFSPYSLDNLYKSYGFDKYPPKFTVRICPLEGVSDTVVNEYKKLMWNVAQARKTAVNLKSIEKKDIAFRLIEMGEHNAKPRDGVCILFILPHSEQKPTNDTFKLLESLESKRVPFRRCFANDNLNYSIPDQFPSLLFAAGGVPHQSPILGGRAIWTLGIDLGHNVNRNISTLAVTLVDPGGILKAAWLTDHPRDETINQQKMSVILQKCKQELIDRGQKNANILVIRDGKKPTNENENIYHNILTSKLTFLELKKRGNPQIIRNSDIPSLQKNPCALIIPNSLTMYLITKTPTKFDMLPSILKVNWKENLNNLNLSPKDISAILTTSAAAPGLGNKEHYLPAAIYWADGIAKTNENDLRFRGLPVLKV